MQIEPSALCRLDFGIKRRALAPVPAEETGANALRLISPTQLSQDRPNRSCNN